MYPFILREGATKLPRPTLIYSLPTSASRVAPEGPASTGVCGKTQVWGEHLQALSKDLLFCETIPEEERSVLYPFSHLPFTALWLCYACIN